jgi:hypothetical protein
MADVTATEPWLHRASCAGKAAYVSAHQAERGIRKQPRSRQFNREPGERLSAYRCRYCSAWHIGRGGK